jgi:hypothetical protein
MAAKNGCTEAARLLLAHGAFVEAKANVCFHGTMLSVFGSFQIKNKNCGKQFLIQTFLFTCLIHAEWNDTVTPCSLVLN